MATSQLHEDFSREEHVKAGSDRGFGFVFAGFFGILSALNLWRHGTEQGAAWKWMLPVAASRELPIFVVSRVPVTPCSGLKMVVS